MLSLLAGVVLYVIVHVLITFCYRWFTSRQNSRSQAWHSARTIERSMRGE